MTFTHPFLLLVAGLVASSLAAPEALGQSVIRTFPSEPTSTYETEFFDSVGDLDGDGYPEVALHGRGGVFQFIPYVKVWSVIDQRTLYSIVGPMDRPRFGTSLAGIGDVDGDGNDDLAIGSLNGDGTALRTGTVEVYSGTGNALLYSLSGQSTGDRFGCAMVGVGDVDGDGRPDFAVGARGRSSVAPQAGGVELYSGATGSLLWFVEGPGGAAFFGTSLDSIDDLDGDGLDDLIVGAPGSNTSAPGAVHLLSSATGGTLRVITPSASSGLLQRFGLSVSALGDVNGDLVCDLVISAPGDSAVGIGVGGTVFIVSGADGTTLLSVNGAPAGGSFGRRVEGTSDFDSDGRPDFVADAFLSGVGASTSWIAVYSSSTGQEIQRLDASPGNDSRALRVCPAGDYDGDGFDELLVADPTYGVYDLRLGRDAEQFLTCLPPAVNSSQRHAFIEFQGSSSIALGESLLRTEGMPPGATAFSLTSLTAGYVPGAGGGIGALCLGGSIGRFVGPGQVMQAGGDGTTVLAIDLESLPQPNGAVVGMAGQRWQFQTWYRDTLNGQPTSNLSSAIEVELR